MGVLDKVPFLAGYNEQDQINRSRESQGLQTLGQMMTLQQQQQQMMNAPEDRLLKNRLINSQIGEHELKGVQAQLAQKKAAETQSMIEQWSALPDTDPRKAMLQQRIRINIDPSNALDPAKVSNLPWYVQRGPDGKTTIDPAYAEFEATKASKGGTRINIPKTEPLVQIIGPNGSPTWVERKDAVGKTPAGAGSKAEAVAAGKTEIDRDVITLKSALDQLKVGGGITSTEKGVLPNVGAWSANTGVGQTLGSMGGTTNQKARDVIAQARPLLLRSIMQATGMSAKNLDSNAELKLWLSTATDPTKGYEANIEALNNIASKYGSGAIMDQPRDTGVKSIGVPKNRTDVRSQADKILGM